MIGFSFPESRLLYFENYKSKYFIQIEKQQIYSHINTIINHLNKTSNKFQFTVFFCYERTVTFVTSDISFNLSLEIFLI